MIPFDVEKFYKNLIYCEDTHSFVHRLYDAWTQIIPESKNHAQQIAFRVLQEFHQDLDFPDGVPSYDDLTKENSK